MEHELCMLDAWGYWHTLRTATMVAQTHLKVHYMLHYLPCDLFGFFQNTQTFNFKLLFQRFFTYLYADLVTYSIHEWGTYTVFSTITPRTNSSLTTNKAFVFFFIVYILSYNKIKIISINHKLMCTIHFQPLLICLNIPKQRQKQWQ